jgi:hypothetical protein
MPLMNYVFEGVAPPDVNRLENKNIGVFWAQIVLDHSKFDSYLLEDDKGFTAHRALK